MNTIGATIKKLRGAKGVTQEELAEAVNISYQAVSLRLKAQKLITS